MLIILIIGLVVLKWLVVRIILVAIGILLSIARLVAVGCPLVVTPLVATPLVMVVALLLVCIMTHVYIGIRITVHAQLRVIASQVLRVVHVGRLLRLSLRVGRGIVEHLVIIGIVVVGREVVGRVRFHLHWLLPVVYLPIL